MVKRNFLHKLSLYQFYMIKQMDHYLLLSVLILIRFTLCCVKHTKKLTAASDCIKQSLYDIFLFVNYTLQLDTQNKWMFFKSLFNLLLSTRSRNNMTGVFRFYIKFWLFPIQNNLTRQNVHQLQGVCQPIIYFVLLWGQQN